MKHARDDYARIQDPAANPELFVALDTALSVIARPTAYGRVEILDALAALSRVLHPVYEALSVRAASGAGGRPIADDEPVFLLRASDVTAPDTVVAWARLQYDQKGNRDMAGLAVNHADAMRAWQKVNGAKVPDMPGAPRTDNGGSHA